jgi:hypothetical protein
MAVQGQEQSGAGLALQRQGIRATMHAFDHRRALAKGVRTTMTMSKAQFAAFMLLTASAAGIGVGLLTRWLPGGDYHPHMAIPFGSESKPPVAVKEKEPVLYQGKPARAWITLFHDRDPEFRKKAVEPLACIAEVDRVIIPVLLDGLKDKDEKVQDEIARYLENLNPPPSETASALLRSEVDLSSVIGILLKIDPKGRASVPCARSLLEEKKTVCEPGLSYWLMTRTFACLFRCL